MLKNQKTSEMLILIAFPRFFLYSRAMVSIQVKVAVNRDAPRQLLFSDMALYVMNNLHNRYHLFFGIC